MNNPFNQLKRLILSLEEDFEKWERFQNNAAGTRLRKLLHEIKQQASSISQEVQFFKEGGQVALPQVEAPVVTLYPKSAAAQEPDYFQFEQDIFSRVLGSISYNGRTIHTRFSDKQAVNICGKMADAYARNIAIKYQGIATHVQGGIYRYQLHYFANKALSFYGGAILTFLASLRPLRFHNTSALALKRFVPVSDFIDKEVDFPTLTFQTVGGSEFTMAFHLDKGTDKRRKPVQIFRNRIRLGSIDFQGVAFDTEGKVLARTAAVRPTLLIFCEHLEHSENPAFYSGVETGRCFVCSRPLTDPRSIRYGIGPTCLNRAI